MGFAAAGDIHIVRPVRSFLIISMKLCFVIRILVYVMKKKMHIVNNLNYPKYL